MVITNEYCGYVKWYLATGVREMIEEKIGIVIILDALDTKGIWKKSKPMDVIRKRENLVSLERKAFSNYKTDDYLPQIKSFSDTIKSYSNYSVFYQKLYSF